MKLQTITMGVLLLSTLTANAAQQTINSTDNVGVQREKINTNFTDNYTNKANKSATVMQWSEWADGASFTTSSPPVAYNGSLYKCITPYTKVAGETPNTQTEYFSEVTGSGGGIAHATSDGAYYASRNGAWASLAGVFAATLGSDDNYVTDAEKIKLGSLSGANTGDQDLSGYALTSSVLSKTNTTAFTPTADYHPVPKKYVDDSITASGGYTDEQAQDAAGSMFSGNTETGITVTYDDATGKVNFVVPTTLAGFTDDSTHRVVTDTQISTWNAKQNTLLAGTDYLSPTGSAANLTSFPSSLATDAEVATAVSGKANSSAFASAVAFEAAFGWAPGSGSISLSTEQNWSAVQNFNAGITATGINLTLSTLSGIKFGEENWLNDTKGNGDTNYLWSADKIFDQLALKAASDHNHTGTYEPADANIIKAGEIDSKAKLEAIVGESLGGTAGSFAFDTFPAYEDSSHTSGIAVNGTTLAVYSTAAGKWLTVGLTDTLSPTHVTYSLTITPSGFTGADKFTYSSTDYTTEQVITGLSTDASFTVTPDTGRAITCAGTGLTDNTGGSYTANTDTANVIATCTAIASGVSYFVNDTFTDSDSTPVTAHTGETGATWSKSSQVDGDGTIMSNAVYLNYGTGAFRLIASSAPASANYTVGMDLKKFRTDSGTNSVSLLGRYSTAGYDTAYILTYSEATSTWSLNARYGENDHSIGTPYVHAMTLNQTYNVKLVMSGATISVVIDGATVISTTDSNITSAGKAGFGFSIGSHVSDFTIDNVKAM